MECLDETNEFGRPNLDRFRARRTAHCYGRCQYKWRSSDDGRRRNIAGSHRAITLSRMLAPSPHLLLWGRVPDGVHGAVHRVATRWRIRSQKANRRAQGRSQQDSASRATTAWNFLAICRTSMHLATNDTPIPRSACNRQDAMAASADLTWPLSPANTKRMAYSFLIFDFGSNEEAAQQARHRIDGWKQGFRLDKKLQTEIRP